MDFAEYPSLSILICPFLRTQESLSQKKDNDDIQLINFPYKVKSDNSFDSSYSHLYELHQLDPLYWCNNKEPGDESLCFSCKCKEIGTTYYFCVMCRKSYHKECVESPPLIKSLYHPKHDLQLLMRHPFLPSEIISCSYCDAIYGSNFTELYYYCSVCKYSLDPVCARRPSFLNYQKRHEHNLNYFPRKADLICDVCGVVNRKDIIYLCLQCDFVVHKTCIYLPFVIRISRHDHRLSFTYSMPRILSCGVCRQKVDGSYGNYSCIKDCTFVVHSKCAVRKDVWDGKELEEEPEEEYEHQNSFEVIGDGIIQHFSHSHYMRFEKKTIDIVCDEKTLCQACLLPFYGGGVYKCMKSNCEFVLHEACANLPRAKQHIAHPYPFILQVSDTKGFYCQYCDRFSSGFRYVCREGGKSISIDARCATISEPLDHQCHPHPLFLSNELGKYRPCSICGKEKLQTLNCIECDFFLCFYCATLPYKVRYEHDEHLLTLTYKEISSLNWCEGCEETLDSNKWIYTCNECGAAYHIPCLLGKCAFYVKPGQIMSKGGNLNIIMNNGLTRLICNYCGRRCNDKLMLDFYDNDARKRLLCYRHWEVYLDSWDSD